MPVADVHVQRHLVTCRVLGHGPAGEQAVRAAVDQGLSSDLDEAFGAVGLDGYWVVRRVDVVAQVGATWSSAQMGVSVARGIAREVGDLVRRGVDPEGALWFPDRAAFVSSFLLDAAEGRAAGRWEYAQFADLSASAPAVALASREPDTVADALLLMTPGEVASVAVALDGDALLATLATPGLPSLAPVLAAVRRLLPAGRLDLPRGAALVLAVTASREGGLPLSSVASVAREAADLLALTRHARPRATGLLAAVRDGQWRDAAALASSDAYLSLVRWSQADRAALVEAVAAPESASVTTDRVHTPFGGGLLLVPLLDDLWDWSAATRSWPDGAPGAAQLLCLTAALGRGASLAAAADPTLRAALAVPADVDVLAWLARVGQDEVAAFEDVAGRRLADPVELAVPQTPAARLLGRTAGSVLRELGRRLPGMASASPAYLWRNVLDVDAWVTHGERETVVELGRAPLSVLLSMTGLDRTTFVVGEVRWTLTTGP